MPAQSMSITDKIKVLVEWSPAIQLVTAISAAPPGRERALAIVRLLKFAASKSEVAMDDQLCLLVENLLLTPEGGALVDYISGLINGLSQQAGYEQTGLAGS